MSNEASVDGTSQAEQSRVIEPVIIIGGGPCGLAAAVAMRDAGIEALLIEKGCLVNSIFNYPTNLSFFSTAEMLEVGGIPFTTPNDKPTRNEALHYYRHVSQRKGIRFRTYEEVTEVTREDGIFRLQTANRFGETAEYRSRFVIVSTGYFDQPNMLGIPGEELPKVSHYFYEAHPYQGLEVAIIGGRNSSIDAAMELERAGAKVTVVYRGSELTASVKPWVRPVYEALLNKQRIKMLFNAQVIGIDKHAIRVKTPDGELELPNDYVFALTGFHPDRSLLASQGVAWTERNGAPVFDPETMETSVPGLFIAGVLAAGRDANEIFIENGRHHGTAIAAVIKSRLDENSAE